MKNDQANKWLDFAWEDLRIIDDLIEEEAYGLACFHAQQAIEKTLKAYLAWKEGKVNKLHSLAELLNLCSNLDNSFKDFEDYALTIDRYYIPVRYPDALPGSLPEGMPNKEDSEEALKMAEEIFEFVKNKIKINKNNQGGFKMNTKNAFSTLLTVLTTAVIVGVLTGVISYSYATSKKDLEIEDLKDQLSQVQEQALVVDETITSPSTPSVPSNTSPSLATDETADWKTYTNDKYGFSFQYPGGCNGSGNETSFRLDCADIIFQTFSPMFKGGFEDVESLADETITIGKKSFTAMRHKKGNSDQITHVLNTDKGFGLIYSFSKNNTESKYLINRILATFQFTK